MFLTSACLSGPSNFQHLLGSVHTHQLSSDGDKSDDMASGVMRLLSRQTPSSPAACRKHPCAISLSVLYQSRRPFTATLKLFRKMIDGISGFLVLSPSSPPLVLLLPGLTVRRQLRNVSRRFHPQVLGSTSKWQKWVSRPQTRWSIQSSFDAALRSWHRHTSLSSRLRIAKHQADERKISQSLILMSFAFFLLVTRLGPYLVTSTPFLHS